MAREAMTDQVDDAPSTSLQTTPVGVGVFGTGAIGVEVIRGAAARPDLVLAGGVALDPTKAGRDLGELAQRDALGIAAVGSLQELLANPDVESVIYCGLGTAAEVAKVLGQIVDTGRDAITTTGLVHPRTALGDEGAAALAERAVRGGGRIVGAGWNPGFLLDVLPVAWGWSCNHIDRLHMRRVGEVKSWGTGILDEMGLGLPPEDAPPPIFSLAEPLALIDDALGLRLDRTENVTEPYVTKIRREYGTRVVEPGCISGFRNRSIGYRGTSAVVELEWLAIFCISQENDELDEVLGLRIEGDTLVEMQARGTFFSDPYPATAARLLNTVRPLRTLPPGLYRPDQLPLSA